MKFFFYLFAFYLLLLPVTGIAGNSNCDLVEHAEVSAVAGADHEEDHEETCTPFCNCSCCFHTAPSHFELQKLVPVLISFIERKYSFYTSHFYPSGALENIWQPPRC